MSKIAIITKYPKFTTFFQDIIKNFPNEKIELYLGNSDDEIISLLSKAENDGCNAIVTGAFTYEVISEKTDVPIIDVEASMHDIIVAWNRVKIKKIKPKNVAVFLLHSNPILKNKNLKEELSVLFDANVELTIFYSKNEYEYLIESLKGKVDLIIAGEHSIEVCERLGIKNEFLQIGFNNLLGGVAEAISISKAQIEERLKRQRLQKILNANQEGMVFANKNGIIEEYNSGACNILSITADHNLKGHFINDIFPNLIENNNIENTMEFDDKIYKLKNGKNIIISLKVIELIHECEGFFLVLREIESIEKTEKTIRLSNKKGYIAKYKLDDIIGDSKDIIECKRLVKRFGMFDGNVLITGETGTGKELFAQAIHNESNRKKEPFFAINCAALPVSILESELFGYSSGSFTGANKEGKAGIFELAHGGTIYLDEISEMDLSSQSKLLRVLQEKEVRRIGGDKIIPVNVRVIAASNRNMWNQVQEKKFREDLYYRINVMNLLIKPLRERKVDIKLLLEYYFKIYGEKYNSNRAIKLSNNAIEFIYSYSWNGNVRELQNFVERIFVYGYENQELDVKILSELIYEHKYTKKLELLDGNRNDSSDIELDEIVTLKEAEDMAIKKALEKTNGNKTLAAKMLGVSRTYLWRRISEMQ